MVLPSVILSFLIYINTIIIRLPDMEWRHSCVFLNVSRIHLRETTFCLQAEYCRFVWKNQIVFKSKARLAQIPGASKFERRTNLSSGD